MNSTPAPKITKRRSYFLLAIMIATVLILVLLSTQGKATNFSSASDLTATTIPPAILTRLAQDSAPISVTQTPQTDYFARVTQTYIAAVQTAAAGPTFDPQRMYPITSQMISAEELLAGKLNGTLAGYGMLSVIEPPVVLHGPDVGAYELNDLAWELWTYDSFFIVWTGHMSEQPSQGIVWVQTTPRYGPSQGIVIVKSSVQAGDLKITGAIKDRLILNSEKGQILYFDMPSLSFVNGPNETIATLTPYPTGTNPFGSVDDAPDIPSHVYYDYQLENTDLNFFINSSNDYDWHLFYSRASGPITVSLTSPLGSYGLRVVHVADGFGTVVGEDITEEKLKKHIMLPDAVSGSYVVRVWSVDGSYNDSLPYTLRFESPEPERILPILECVDENPNGTYTAHFGYENPNSFVVVVDAEDYQNEFEPSPIFRTGQPEGFAPGRVTDWFSVLFDGNDLVWRLDGHTATANRNSQKCP